MSEFPLREECTAPVLAGNFYYLHSKLKEKYLLTVTANKRVDFAPETNFLKS